MAAPRPSSSDLSFFSKSKYTRSNASNASSSAGSRVVVKKTPIQNIAQAGALQVTARSATPSSSPVGTPLTDVKGKRKSEEPCPMAKKSRVATHSPSETAFSPRLAHMPSCSTSATPSLPSSSSLQSSVSRSSMPPTRRSGRSRPASVPPSEALLPRECWTDDDGTPGPSCLTSEYVVRKLMRSYKSYFRNPIAPGDKSFDPHPTNYPVVELEYPNSGASERFVLLQPKDPDHYNPIMCLEGTLRAIIKGCLTQEQQAMFGTLPDTILTDEEIPALRSSVPLTLVPDTAVDSSPSPPVLSAASSPAPSVSDTSTSSASSSSSIFSSVSSASSISSLSSVSSLSSFTDLSNYAVPCLSGPPKVDYLRLFQRAINTHDGPLLLKVMNAINALLRLLKYPPIPADPFEPTLPNHIQENIKSWTSTPKDVTARMVEEVYQRAVGPNIAELRRYSAFSSEAYGELMPSLVSQILQDVSLREDSLFVDLGCGVGNVVLQASLQTGCTSYGIEIMPQPAKLARSQLEQFRIRSRMWGVRMGEVELDEGDLLTSRRVNELIPKADVVLINNKVFSQALNEAIRPKFLDLKEGAIVVSLERFGAKPGARFTERNLDDISAIFDVTERRYYPGHVSWVGTGGSYWLQRVDREGYARIKQKFESSSTRTKQPLRGSRLKG